MMRVLTIITILLLAVVGCTPNPRYRKERVMTPRETVVDPGRMTTSEYLRFGLILQRHLGKPYKGSSKWEEGLDCSKFTSEVFREFKRTNLPRTVALQVREGKEVPRNRLRYADLVFFRTERNRISHVGVYIGNNEFIHASTSRGVIISNLSEKYWAERYASARRILNLPQ